MLRRQLPLACALPGKHGSFPAAPAGALERDSCLGLNGQSGLGQLPTCRCRTSLGGDLPPGQWGTRAGSVAAAAGSPERGGPGCVGQVVVGVSGRKERSGALGRLAGAGHGGLEDATGEPSPRSPTCAGVSSSCSLAVTWAADPEGAWRGLWVLSHSSVTRPRHCLVPSGCWPCPGAQGWGVGDKQTAGAQRGWWTRGCGAGRGARDPSSRALASDRTVTPGACCAVSRSVSPAGAS